MTRRSFFGPCQGVGPKVCICSGLKIMHPTLSKEYTWDMVVLFWGVKPSKWNYVSTRNKSHVGSRYLYPPKYLSMYLFIYLFVYRCCLVLSDLIWSYLILSYLNLSKSFHIYLYNCPLSIHLELTCEANSVFHTSTVRTYCFNSYHLMFGGFHPSPWGKQHGSNRYNQPQKLWNKMVFPSQKAPPRAVCHALIMVFMRLYWAQTKMWRQSVDLSFSN